MLFRYCVVEGVLFSWCCCVLFGICVMLCLCCCASVVCWSVCLFAVVVVCSGVLVCVGVLPCVVVCGMCCVVVFVAFFMLGDVLCWLVCSCCLW